MRVQVRPSVVRNTMLLGPTSPHTGGGAREPPGRVALTAAVCVCHLAPPSAACCTRPPYGSRHWLVALDDTTTVPRALTENAVGCVAAGAADALPAFSVALCVLSV